MNTRADMSRSYLIDSTTPTYSGGDSLPPDIPSRFPAARPSMSVNSGRRSRGAAATKSFGVTDMTRSQSDTPHNKRKDDDTYYHVISRFPRERPSSLVNTGTRKEWTTSGSYDSDINGKTRSMVRNVAKDGAMVSTPSEAEDWPTHQFLDKQFPNERPSSLVNTGTRKEWTTSGSYYSDIKGKERSMARNDPNDASIVSTPSVAADWSTQQFLDKPRPFLTSNTSGIRFKRSSDLRHEEKNANFDRWTDMPDIDALRGLRQSNEAPDRMAMTKLSRTISPSPFCRRRSNAAAALTPSPPR